jgi:hypothetical protein
MTIAARDRIASILADTNGIIPLDPAWVARDWLPPGRRLRGLAEAEYDLGERGFICERWLGSTTHASNRISVADEGLSYCRSEHDRMLLAEMVAADPAAIMGVEYAETHAGLGRLPKIFDYGARIPYHIHPRREHAALVGRNAKEEAYYFPEGVSLGDHPETFFGVHPSIVDRGKGEETLLPYLEKWDSDLILQESTGYVQVPGDGWHVPAGILHAPGTAVTVELQEDSDAMLMFQALNAGKIISKEMLYTDVAPDRRAAKAERAALEWVDWPVNGDPYFYENHHVAPTLEPASVQPGGRQEWLFCNSDKFSGKRLTVEPGRSYTSLDRGVYNLLVFGGEGTFDGVRVRAEHPGEDELLVVHERAIKPITVRNTGREPLVIVKFFGPGINPDRPGIKPYTGPESAR